MHPAWWTIALQTLNFAILVWLLHRFLYKPVLAVIDERKAEVRRQFEAAGAADEKAKAQLAALASERAGIAAEYEAALKAAADEAQAMAETLRAQAQHDAATLLDAGRRTLADERAAAFDEARLLALDLGTGFARKLLADIPLEARAEAWIGQIEAYLKGLPAATREALSRQLGEGAALTVVSASALPEAAQDGWRERLRRALAVGAPIAFAIDPDLIAGAELHFPDSILRFSWQSELAAARAGMTADAQPR